MKPLSARRLLFVGIGFYDYEACIVARLRARGTHVTAFADQPTLLREGLLASFFRRTGLFVDHIQRRHERRILRAAETTRFDQVLVIKGTGLGLKFLRALRERQPDAEFILYLWDSIARMPGYASRRPFFDRVLSFDRQDVQDHRDIAFRPLFYRESEVPAADGPPIDIAFVGWLHSDRLAIARRVQAQAKALGLACFVYLYTGFFTWLRLALRGQAHDVHFRTLPYGELMAINARTRVVLDLPHAAQTGLTMRTIEAIGLGRKLLTTGRDVVNYDFFSQERVRVVDAAHIEVDPSFVTSAPHPLDEQMRRRYGLDAWLDELLEAQEPPRVQP